MATRERGCYEEALDVREAQAPISSLLVPEYTESRVVF